MMEVFVYGTLKPNESNFSAYCAGKGGDSVVVIAA